MAEVQMEIEKPIDFGQAQRIGGQGHFDDFALCFYLDNVHCTSVAGRFGLDHDNVWPHGFSRRKVQQDLP